MGLQGGGAYGAYGWGVIDRLLEEHVEIVAVSGASAAALNGAALISGLVSGGDEAARATLTQFWRMTADRSPLHGFDMLGFSGPLFDPFVSSSLSVARQFAAYASPFWPTLRGMGVLRSVASETIDLDLLARQERLPLHVSATDVLTGAPRLFTGAEVTLDALMASSYLPELFAAVEIDGRRYWDGGYAANPALEPWSAP